MRRTTPLQEHIHEIIFEAETPAGRGFDVALLVVILVSVTAVILESVQVIEQDWGPALRVLEWIVTILFTIEYGLRLYCVRRPLRYAVSFFGIIDLLSILPTYLSLFIVGSQSLLVIRVLRLLRVFRIFKLVHFLYEATVLAAALRASLRKIIVFVGSVVAMITILGTIMYMIEGPEHGFTNIPKSVYWAVVTMTTVGYGDITPQTIPGKVLASVAMIIGYGIIAVPTGIVTMELSKAAGPAPATTRACRNCSAEAHRIDARFCRVCGEPLPVSSAAPPTEKDPP